jgi:hypothetical protein
LFAKIFNQIYDSSIVESPETRFTFMDLLILSDKNGVVDMTHEAIARRTNRPLELVKKTIAELEGPDPRSRTPDADGARIFRLDDHRDWGWGIINYDYFRKLASEDQRREKTRLRVAKLREKKRKLPKESLPVTQCNAPLRSGNDSPSASASTSTSKEEVQGKPNLVPTAEDIYRAYPRHEAKPDALTAIRKAISKGFGAAYLLERTVAYAKTQPPRSRFTPLPATWFNSERFNDDPAEWVRLERNTDPNKRPSRQSEAERWYEKKYGTGTD